MPLLPVEFERPGWLFLLLLIVPAFYIAFRSVVPGQATGPHIHIGPPSLRIDSETLDRELDALFEDAAAKSVPE